MMFDLFCYKYIIDSICRFMKSQLRHLSFLCHELDSGNMSSLSKGASVSTVVIIYIVYYVFSKMVVWLFQWMPYLVYLERKVLILAILNL